MAASHFYEKPARAPIDNDKLDSGWVKIAGATTLQQLLILKRSRSD